ncbi:hypothetical protein U0070_005253, partial [Myodes glareolus]
RGLNPPHRVKSISMTTFTEPEVLFLQSRGNEVCRKIWLGLFDARTSLIPDSRDPQKVKEFLQEKYEKKRWYVPPEQVKGPPYSKGSASTPVQGPVPEGKPVRTLLGEPVPSLSDAASSSSLSANQSQARTAQARSSQPPSQSSTKKASTDLLADIGGDPFAAPQVAPAFAAFPAFGGQTPSHGGFANFDAFSSSPGTSAFGSLPPSVQTPFQAQPAPAGSNQMSAFGAAPLAAGTQPSSLADVGGLLGPRVAAGGLPGSAYSHLSPCATVFLGYPARSLHYSHLCQALVAMRRSPLEVSPTRGDLEGGMGEAPPKIERTQTIFFSPTSLPFAAFTNPFATPAQPQLPSTNPFQPNGLASGPGFGMSGVGPGLLQPVPPTGAFASPFPAPMFPTQAALTEQQNGSSFGDLGTSKLGQRPLNQATGISTNPFMTGSSAFASKPPTTNPFL